MQMGYDEFFDDNITPGQLNQYFDNSINELKDLIMKLKLRKRIYLENKEKWEADAVVGIL